MKELPILFSSPMVRALLNGSKTQTRRVIKPQPVRIGDSTVLQWRDGLFQPERLPTNSNLLSHCPYGQPGDRLWVRETWGYRCSASTPEADRYMHTIAYRADDVRRTYGPMPIQGVGLPKWRERDEGMSWEAWDARMTAYWRQWRPSIHMPLWASRITLEIMGVRVERLQDISEADCVSEGIRISSDARRSDACYGIYECLMPDGKTHFNDSAYALYRTLWEQINGPGSWYANPWVWVIEFRRIKP